MVGLTLPPVNTGELSRALILEDTTQPRNTQSTTWTRRLRHARAFVPVDSFSSTFESSRVHGLTSPNSLLYTDLRVSLDGAAQREVPWAAMGVHCSCYSFAKPPMYRSFPNRNLACPDPSLNLRRRRRSRFDYLVLILESLKPFFP